MKNCIEKSNTYYEYIDIIKGVGIALVLLGHILQDGIPLKSVIYSFHMPLFFVVAGLTLKDESFKERIQKRFYSLYIPYILWGMIFSSFSFKNLALILYGTNESLTKASSNGMLWFLTVLFIASVLSGVLFSLIKTKYKSICLVVASVCLFILSIVMNMFHDIISVKNYALGLPLALDIVFMAASFIIIGKIISCEFLPKVQNLKNSFRLLIGLALSLVSLCGILQKNEHGYSQMATYDVGNPIFYWLVAIMACVGIILLSQLIAESFKGRFLNSIKRMMIWLGRNSLLIFIMHRTLLYNLKNIYASHNSLVVCVILWLVLMIYSSLTSFIIGKICPVLAGKYRPRATNK